VTLSHLLAGYDHVLLDLDGCVWVGDDATPRAVEAVDALREAGKGVAFCTNDGRRSVEEFVQKLWGLGFRASIEEVVTVGAALQFVLASTPDWKRAFVIGSDAIHRHVEAAGLRETMDGADVVVIAGHDRFDYDELRLAVQAILGGAQALCTSRDATFPMPDGPWPGTGSIVAAVEAATGIEALTVGKPSPDIFQTALDRLGPGRALVIGDREDADLAGARAANLDGALVGGERSDDAVACATTLAHLVLA
jgi:HAD superfamily hydrolase (TIGR01450 family)